MPDQLLIDLKKGVNLRVRRFKKHDRLYWTSAKDKLNITGTLRCKVEEIDDPELKNHILQNAEFLN